MNLANKAEVAENIIHQFQNAEYIGISIENGRYRTIAIDGNGFFPMENVRYNDPRINFVFTINGVKYPVQIRECDQLTENIVPNAPAAPKTPTTTTPPKKTPPKSTPPTTTPPTTVTTPPSTSVPPTTAPPTTGFGPKQNPHPPVSGGPDTTVEPGVPGPSTPSTSIAPEQPTTTVKPAPGTTAPAPSSTLPPRPAPTINTTLVPNGPITAPRELMPGGEQNDQPGAPVPSREIISVVGLGTLSAREAFKARRNLRK